MAKIKVSELTLKSVPQSLNALVALPQVSSLSASTLAVVHNQLVVQIGKELDLSVKDTEEVLKLVLDKTVAALTAHTAAHKK